MSFEINDKVALVTGGANGIGLAYVKELIKHGIRNVAIIDIDRNGSDVAEQLNKEYGTGKVIFIQADVARKNELSDAFEKAVTTFKGLDIVVNNAGVLMENENGIAINCGAVLEGSLLGTKYMGRNNGGKGGVIVNISSILGLQPLSGCPVYVGTKHFLIGFTRSMGSDFYEQQTGIKFLALCPGLTDTILVSKPNKNVLPGFPGLGQLLDAQLNSLPAQSTSAVAEGLIYIIRNGKNGSIWVSEEGDPVYEVKIPDRKTLRVN